MTKSELSDFWYQLKIKARAVETRSWVSGALVVAVLILWFASGD